MIKQSISFGIALAVLFLAGRASRRITYAVSSSLSRFPSTASR